MRLLVLAVALLSACHLQVRPTTEAREIAATVRLISVAGSCSGVIVGAHNILTAAHCKSDVILVADYTGKVMCVAATVKVDEAADLMLLGTKCNLPVRASVASREPSMGTRVQVTGHPLGVSFPVMTEGFLTTVTQKHSIAHNKQVLSAPIIGGNSGGPVWLDGEVVGIVSCGHREYHHINFIVRQRTIQEFLNGQQL